MKRYQLLYVDDEEDNLLAFKAVFRRHFDVTIALSGQEALDQLEQIQPQIIIADQRMPNMTGADLLEQVAAKYPTIIRMILTGYSDMQAIVKAINKGKIYHYLTKPWNFDEVKIVIDNALEIYELRNQNAELQLQNAELEKENALAQLEVLKNQLNPHFLFNSLNILRALIDEDSKRASKYATNFSKLYRKLLEMKSQRIVSLGEELEFVQHYVLLQKTRFEDSLNVNFQLAEEELKNCLPPFTLQLLIENAIKHNIISSQHILQIDVTIEGENLVVSNNLQLRQHTESSTGIGWKNLVSRYQILINKSPNFEQRNGQYVVRVPLIPVV